MIIISLFLFFLTQPLFFLHLQTKAVFSYHGSYQLFFICNQTTAALISPNTAFIFSDKESFLVHLRKSLFFLPSHTMVIFIPPFTMGDFYLSSDNGCFSFLSRKWPIFPFCQTTALLYSFIGLGYFPFHFRHWLILITPRQQLMLFLPRQQCILLIVTRHSLL